MAQFTLSWDAHKNNICTGLTALQQNGEFVDMTLAADGHHVKVHQMVMSLASPYIKDIITSTQCSHPVIFLNKISYATLCAILEYIYTGEVVIAKDNMNELLAAGKELHIKGLQDMNVDISANCGAASSQVAGYNEGHQLTVRHKDPDKAPTKEYLGCTDTPTTRAKMKKEPQKPETTHEEVEDFAISGLSDNADDEPYEPMDTDNEKAAAPTTTTNKVSGLRAGQIDTRVQYTLSNQGSLQMILNRYIYLMSYSSLRDRSVKRWRCADNKLKCPATVITKDEVVVERRGAHTHPFHDKRILKKVRDKAIFSAIVDAEQSQTLKKQTNPADTSQDSIPIDK